MELKITGVHFIICSKITGTEIVLLTENLVFN